MGTATAKRTDTAEAILSVHGLDGYFDVINGTDLGRTTKAETIQHTLTLLGDPDPAEVIMVGDRHSDISGARVCGVRSVAVTWGYGSRDELVASAPDWLVDEPSQILPLLATSSRVFSPPSSPP